MLAAIVFIKPSMSNQQQLQTSDSSHGLPPKFTVFYAVLPGDVQRVFEHQQRRLKTNTMLSPIALILHLIP